MITAALQQKWLKIIHDDEGSWYIMAASICDDDGDDASVFLQAQAWWALQQGRQDGRAGEI